MQFHSARFFHAAALIEPRGNRSVQTSYTQSYSARRRSCGSGLGLSDCITLRRCAVVTPAPGGGGETETSQMATSRCR